MPTSDERREVAERLRAKYRERNAPGMFEVQDVYMQRSNYLQDLVGCLPDGDSAFTVLADLIDPTCEDVSEPPESGGFWPAPHFKCSVCGTQHVSVGYVRYCPNCGARVVSGDE